MIIMMYACEVAANVIAKKIAEEEVKKQAELKRIAEAMEQFEGNLKSIDTYVEKKLIAGNGQASLLIDRVCWSCEGFWFFAEKDFRYSSNKPYWYNVSVSAEFPLEFYIQYLRDHCFNVEIIECPFTAYSSTGKSERKMDGITLKISI